MNSCYIVHPVYANQRNTVESQLSELQLSEHRVSYRNFSYPNTKNKIVARANLDNFLITPPH